MNTPEENIQGALSRGLISEEEARHLRNSSDVGVSPLVAGTGLVGAGLGGLAAARGAKTLGTIGKAIGAKGAIGGAIGAGIGAGIDYANEEQIGLISPAIGALAAGGITRLGPLKAAKALGQGISKTAHGVSSGVRGAINMLDSKPGMIGAGVGGGVAGGAAAGMAAGGMEPPPEAGMDGMPLPQGGDIGGPPGPPPGPDPKQVEQMFAMLMDPQTDPATKKKIMGIMSDMGLLEGAPVGEGAAMGGLGGAALGAGGGALAGSKGMLGSMPPMPAGPGASLGPMMGGLGEKMGMGAPIGLKKGAGLGGALGGLAGAGLGAMAGKMLGPPPPGAGFEDPLM